MKDPDQIPTKTTQTLAQILVNVLIRRFAQDRADTREEKT